MMIWGMTLQPGYEYTEFVDDEVRLSMASLECRPRKSQGGSLELSSHVVLKTARGEFLLCTLEKGPTPQQSLDLVLQPREKVTFSVEGTGIVHLMGYTSEGPDEQQQQVDDEPIQSLPSQLMPPSVEEEDEPILEEDQEEESIIVKNEPESVVIPILEEALEDMDQLAKDETTASSSSAAKNETTALVSNLQAGMQGPSHMQGNMPHGEEEDYPYQDMSEEGWMQTPETSQTPQQDPGSRIDPPQFSQGRVLPGGNVPSTSYPQSRHAGDNRQVAPASNDPVSRNDPAPFTQGRVLPGANVPSTSYSQSRHAGDNRQVAAPASSGSRIGRTPYLARSGHQLLPSFDKPPPLSLQASKNLNCRLCGMDFRDREQLLIHESVHMGKKLHRCAHCGKCFRLRSNLTTHERKHTGEKPYSCRYCSKPFASSSNCKIHERCHTGEKPFKCRFCDMCFITSSNCRKHERRHTGEKPFVCQYCGRAFTTQRSLKAHVIKHTNAMSVAESR